MSSTPDSETDHETLSESGSRPKVDVRSLVRRVLLVIIALLVLPYIMIPVYALPFMRPVSTPMLAELLTFQGYDRRWVPLENISPRLVQSVMMSEDGQFCSHGGVDWNQMQTVVNSALEGESTRGASTIPMQTAKNLFLWNGRSFLRKGLELPLAVVSDFIWSKKRMMEIYLNVAEWGPGIYGIEAASQYHFKVPASKLSARQAALLAVALPNPIDRVAGKPGRGMQRLAGLIERRARASGGYVGCVLD
ncbi:monofunctional biosynthetic peptidoglycan transglycosylase [Agrobacterium rubi TR3 = NBRC 13261]|uniref:Biosynthetic peptidoglycan transglycosylase n=1 Tax=Agrobacterium rubi TR3 = NBRC 13261 TaxID=1368415 RepID=A0A081CXH5_9HYPH|nr:monofunctional biosynthetic peptidoglycan transglycosylase [Agrobacterium rubi]MBP1879695.1 monofunctional biosynthetic peptidoglycan transglycosylase [Agrobacterium rubi]MCL6654491.1 monofunctional biosynthetic peptidoglycan transglycosylase [Agrobacterium rubi]GAK71371.1 monofunctional biosynthetic peptidoglycan transglycosylase [Agrobacterium rubi TR3 = NBRC 13261]